MEKLDLYRYEAVLLDAMGVLINVDGAIPSAIALIDRLNAKKYPYYVVTNISSALDEGILDRLNGYGLDIVDSSRIISAGSVTRRITAKYIEDGQNIAVFGSPAATNDFSGGLANIICADVADDFDTLLILDDEGFDFKAACDRILSVFFKRVRSSRALPRILVANSDVVYPDGASSLRFGPGVLVAMIQEALRAFNGPMLDVTIVGKPGKALFEEAVSRAKSHRLLMVGDQLETDILGAHRYGLDTAHLLTGLNTESDRRPSEATQPTYILRTLDELTLAD